MNPTVGRIVHYWEKQGDGPYAAIVTKPTADPIGPHWDWPVRS